MEGRVLMKILDRAFTGADCVDFLKHLLRQVKGNVIVIWDGASIHRGKAVKEFLRSEPARPAPDSAACVCAGVESCRGNVAMAEASDGQYLL